MIYIPQATLIAVDTTEKSHLAEWAILETLKQCSFGDVKLLTNRDDLKYAVKIPEIKGLEGYSRFMMRGLHRFVHTPFAMVCQWDGRPIQPQYWTDEFLSFDYGGAPFNPSGLVGNGGASLRSKRLMEACSRLPEGNDHPEDAAISICFRQELERQGMKFMPLKLASQFSFEGRSFDGVEWRGLPIECGKSFAFHSYLSVLPKGVARPRIAVHSGDAGDVLYGCATLKALGGGTIFLTPSNQFPYPRDTTWTRSGGSAAFLNNLRPLLEAQDYIWKAQYTHGHVPSCDFDLNRFRLPWKERSTRDNDSILKLHCDAFGVKWDETKPWLTVDEVWPVPGRPICVSRSPRYQNPLFAWDKLVSKYGHLMFFVGTESEAEIFQGFGAPKHKIPWVKTSNLLEAARLIAGAKVFVGNQSAPLAIAHGLCKNCIVEEWLGNPNCRMNRPNAIYWKGGALEIPEDWLK